MSQEHPAYCSLGSFHERALNGQPLRIVFLGGSLTWGANASDPQSTSWRGLMMRYLRDEYTHTPLAFYDAAIGGTGSDLALFRIDRDVIPHQPDLVFLDCTVNDHAEGKDESALASYERVLRDLLSVGAAVLPVLLCFRNHVENTEAIPARYAAHQALASNYNLPAADTLSFMRNLVGQGTVKSANLWTIPRDGSHPGDAGYLRFFEAIRLTYERARTDNATPRVPPLTFFPDLYANRARRILVKERLPEGWTQQSTYRTAMWFDGLSSRWMGDVAAAKTVASKAPHALEIEFAGSMVGLFGERDAISPPFRARIDGLPALPEHSAQGTGDLWQINTTKLATPTTGAGQLFWWLVLTKGLSEGMHCLRIEPDFTKAHPEAEFRLESICSAGR